jgi:hypothetical protein
MNALDAHAMRTRLFDDLGTELGNRLMQGWFESSTGYRSPAPVPLGALASPSMVVAPPDPLLTHADWAHRRKLYSANYSPDEVGLNLSALVRRWIDMGECFYVTDDMMALAQAAAKTMPNETLLAEDLPSTAGFLWLPRAIPHVDVRGTRMRTHAITWAPDVGGEPGTAIALWTDRDDMADEINQDLREQYDRGEGGRTSVTWELLPKLQLQHIYALEFGGPLPTFPNTDHLHEIRERWPHLRIEVAWRTRDSIPEQTVPPWWQPGDSNQYLTWWIPGEDADPDVAAARLVLASHIVPEEPEPTARFMVTFFRLCQQSLTRIERTHPERHARRRAERLQMRDVPVTVITLRRITTEQNVNETHVEWTRRWLVRGFWRNQWYPSEQVHRAIWISPFIKGPADKPLIIRDHVTSLSR